MRQGFVRGCGTLIVALGALTVSGAAQRPIVLRLDPATTHVGWTLDTTFHTVHGSFQLKEGSLRIDPVSGNASGLIVIDAASGESGDAARDRRMHSDILNSGKFPVISFRPAQVQGTIDLATGGSFVVAGSFRLHGEEHPLQILVHLQPGKSGSQGAPAFTAHFVIPFVAWGLKDPSTFVFRTGKEVSIDIDALAAQAEPQSVSH